MKRIDISHVRGDTFTYTFPQSPIDSFVNCWFTLKDQKCESDDDAIIKIDSVSGLLIVNGAPATDPTKGSISVSFNMVTVTIDAEIVASIPTTYPIFYDVQAELAASGSNIIATQFNGRWSNISDVTRRTEIGDSDAMLWPELDVVLWADGTAVLWP